MKKITKIMAVALGTAMIAPATAAAQDKFEVHGSATLTNEYIWRGFDQDHGFAVQPSMTMGYKGLSLNVWGSTPVEASKDKKEIDINLSYAVPGTGLTVTVSDLWWGGKTGRFGYWKGYDDGGNYAQVDRGHHLEATLAYNFGEKFPLTLSWSTWLAGADARKADSGDRAYSTYINASYAINCPYDVTLTPSVGFTPWEGYYSQSATASQDKAWFTDLSLKASKNVKVTNNFEIPVFLQYIVSPATDKTFFVGGFTLGF